MHIPVRFIRIWPVLLVLVLACSLFLPTHVSADGGAPNLAYIAGTDAGITVVDVQQQQVTKTIPISGKPQTVALSLDGRFLYVTQPERNQVSIVNANTGQVICSAAVPGAPNLLVLDSSSNPNMLYAAGSQSAQVTEINSLNCNVKRRLQSAGPVYGLAFAAASAAGSANKSNQLWVANERTIAIFNAVDAQPVTTLDLPSGPRYLSIPPGATVYAATQQGSVVAIDLISHKMSTLITGGTYGPMDYDGITGEIYVPDQKNKQFVVLNPVNSGFQLPKQPKRVLPTKVAPASIAITSDGQLGFAALTDGSVAMYDVPGRQLITTIKVGGQPAFIITGLYPPVLGSTPEQAGWLDTVATVVGYVVVLALLIVPIVLFRRFARVRDKSDTTETLS